MTLPHSAQRSFICVETIAQHLPFWMGGYFLVLFIVRVLMSSNIGLDDAQMVGATDFQLFYHNSHPPLYNWLARIFLEITGWNWALSTAALKYILLFGFFFLVWDLARRITDNPFSILLVSISFLLVPQIVWESQVRLSHSVLVMLGSIATLHAVVRIVQSGRWYDFIWFGLACVIGTLAKFNFLLFLVSVVLVILLNPDLRRYFRRGHVLLSAGIYALFAGPVLVYVILNLDTASQRVKKTLCQTGGLEIYRSTLCWA